MAQMIRKQIYIEPEQYASLKQRAHMQGITEAEVKGVRFVNPFE